MFLRSKLLLKATKPKEKTEGNSYAVPSHTHQVHGPSTSKPVNPKIKPPSVPNISQEEKAVITASQVFAVHSATAKRVCAENSQTFDFHNANC